MKKSKEALSKVISLRITNHDFDLMAVEAEVNNMGVPDVIRGAWREHQSQQELNESLAAVEQRLVRKIFEIVCSVAGLGEQDRLTALKAFKNRLREGFKS